jgi:hypothetical protein
MGQGATFFQWSHRIYTSKATSITSDDTICTSSEPCDSSTDLDKHLVLAAKTKELKDWYHSTTRCNVLVLCAWLCLAGCLVVAGCGGTPVPTQLTQTVGTLTATLTIRPYPPVPMQDTGLELALQDAGQPVSGAAVRLTLTMPGCPMAPSYPQAIEQADGRYAAKTVLTMAGAWQADVDVSLQGKDVRFTFFFATR